jgi:hypothetical protein
MEHIADEPVIGWQDDHTPVHLSSEEVREVFERVCSKDDVCCRPGSRLLRVPGCSFEHKTGEGVWISGEEVDRAALAHLLQMAVRRFDPAGAVGFQYTRDSARPCVDPYGGGAYVVTASSIESVHSDFWLDEQMASR